MNRNHANTPAEAERRIPDLVARVSDPNRAHVEEYLTLKVAQGGTDHVPREPLGDKRGP